MTRKAADNSRFAKAGVWYFYDSEVLNLGFCACGNDSATKPARTQSPKTL